MATSQHYHCEDCGSDFEQILLEIEDEPVVCPDCGGLDIQLVAEELDVA